MLVYTLKRLALAVAVTLVVSALSFGLLYLSGDPAAAIGGEAATDTDIANIRKIYGLDRPIHIQYLTWIGKALQWDFGMSYYFRLPVSQNMAKPKATARRGAISREIVKPLIRPISQACACHKDVEAPRR